MCVSHILRENARVPLATKTWSIASIRSPEQKRLARVCFVAAKFRQGRVGQSRFG